MIHDHIPLNELAAMVERQYASFSGLATYEQPKCNMQDDWPQIFVDTEKHYLLDE